MSWFKKIFKKEEKETLDKGLEKSSQGFFDKISRAVVGKSKVDDEVLVQVYSSSFKPTQKSQSGEFSGATGTVKVVKGDSLCASIAAASVLAKVTRDRYMDDMDALYPQYGFARHKGYGTAAHYAALREYGPSPIHRPTYLRKIH